MLTVKLERGSTMKIVEAETIKIIPVGKPVAPEVPKEVMRIAKELGHDEVHVLGEPLPCTNAVREIIATFNGRDQSFFVGYEGSESICGPVELWNCAYIENSQGATTEKVHGY